MALSGLVALVTGGASGLGRGTAVRLARAGARVCVVDLPAAEELASQVADQAGKDSIAFAPTDVTSEDDVSCWRGGDGDDGW